MLHSTLSEIHRNIESEKPSSFSEQREKMHPSTKNVLEAKGENCRVVCCVCLKYCT